MVQRQTIRIMDLELPIDEELDLPAGWKIEAVLESDMYDLRGSQEPRTKIFYKLRLLTSQMEG